MIADIPPPTVAEARASVRTVFGLTADALDGHLAIGECLRKGRKSRVCNVAIHGPTPMKLRVIVSATEKTFVIRARERR